MPKRNKASYQRESIYTVIMGVLETLGFSKLDFIN